MIGEGALQRVNDEALGLSIYGGDQIDYAFVGNFFRSLPMVENQRSHRAGRMPGDTDKFSRIQLHHTHFRKTGKRMLPNGP